MREERKVPKVSGERPVVIDAAATASFEAAHIGVSTLFATDFFAGVVLGFEPGQLVPEHRHSHKDEVFDVLSGEGEIYVAGHWLPAGPGMMVYVPPGVAHALRNTGRGRWVLRETARERVYARTALRLVGQAIAKRWRRLRF